MGNMIISIREYHQLCVAAGRAAEIERYVACNDYVNRDAILYMLGIADGDKKTEKAENNE